MKEMIISTLIIGLLILAGCEQTPATSGPGGEVNTVPLTGEVKEFEIIAKLWEFVPNTIEVNLGDEVELHLQSVDVAHGFLLSEFGINERLEPNQDVHINFIADKRGTFTFMCSVPCGSGHGGMRGQLIVK